MGYAGLSVSYRVRRGRVALRPSSILTGETMQEEILYNAGLCDVLDTMNDSLFNAGTYGKKLYLEISDKIELARKTHKQEGTEL